MLVVVVVVDALAARIVERLSERAHRFEEGTPVKRHHTHIPAASSLLLRSPGHYHQQPLGEKKPSRSALLESTSYATYAAQSHDGRLSPSLVRDIHHIPRRRPRVFFLEVLC